MGINIHDDPVAVLLCLSEFCRHTLKETSHVPTFQPISSHLNSSVSDVFVVDSVLEDAYLNSDVALTVMSRFLPGRRSCRPALGEPGLSGRVEQR